MCSAENQIEDSPFGKFWVNNCGLNVTIAAAVYFGVDQHINNTELSSAFGDRAQNAGSLLDIKNILQRLDLRVEAFGGVLPADILSFLDAGNAVIVLNKANVNHFLIVFPSRNAVGKFQVVDVPKPEITLERQQLEESLDVLAGDAVLVISDKEVEIPVLQPSQKVKDTSPPSAQVLPDMAGDRHDSGLRFHEPIEVATSGLGSEPIVVPVYVSNDNDFPISFSKPKGECSCFLGVETDFVIPANGERRLEFKFNPSILARSESTRVVFEIDNPACSVAEFKFNVLKEFPGRIFQIPKFVRARHANAGIGTVCFFLGTPWQYREKMKILDVECDVPSIKFQVVDLGKNEIFGKDLSILRIEGAVNESEFPDGVSVIPVKVKTNNPNDPVILFNLFK